MRVSLLTYNAALGAYNAWEIALPEAPPKKDKGGKEEKAEGGLGWKAQAWKQRLFEDMNIAIARSNYLMLSERTLPFGAR